MERGNRESGSSPYSDSSRHIAVGSVGLVATLPTTGSSLLTLGNVATTAAILLIVMLTIQLVRELRHSKALQEELSDLGSPRTSEAESIQPGNDDTPSDSAVAAEAIVPIGPVGDTLRLQLLCFLTTGCAHEVGNALTSIQWGVIPKVGLPMDEESAGDIRRIAGDTLDEAFEMIHELRLLSQDSQTATEACDLTRVMRGVERALTLMVRNLNVSWNCGDQVVECRIDPRHFKQALLQMVTQPVDAADNLMTQVELQLTEQNKTANVIVTKTRHALAKSGQARPHWPHTRESPSSHHPAFPGLTLVWDFANECGGSVSLEQRDESVSLAIAIPLLEQE